MKRILSLAIGFCLLLLLNAQPLQRRVPYDISKDKVLYTIGYAHLDTEWNWDYQTTIDEYIKRTMEDNFRLFEKYPDYVFNFTGSRRYRMMKEYYPDLYAKVKDYVRQGRWCVAGSSVDEGEVNISSSESLIRQILYGNNYFKKEFGAESTDYMLPDCFGFLSNLPTVFHHCGLLGFSTQKLTWRSAVGIPFNIGVWNGPDGNGIVAALNATSYVGKIGKRLDKDKSWSKRLEENRKKTGFGFDYRYYGVGDRGGAPREDDVKNAEGSLRNTDSRQKVLLTASDQMYKDITPEIRKNLPVYSGDLLLIEHSAGSLTSQAYMKRLNRKNELLAEATEPLAAIADATELAVYQFDKLNRSWDLVLGSQFHDILPGTSIPKAYEYAWNDEFIAANGFSEVLRHSLGAITSQLDTRAVGRSIVVYNPVACSREDVVTAELEYSNPPLEVTVFDREGEALPTQIIERKNNKLKLIFTAKIPSLGLAFFDVREGSPHAAAAVDLSVTNTSLVNEYYRVKLAENGDIVSIWDKKAEKELLSAPARLEFLKEQPDNWPAWNMDWKDRKKAPVEFMGKEASLEIVEQGPVRVAIQVKRKGQGSAITQIFSLAAGDAGKRLEVTNKIDWQSREVCLKASFPLAVSNKDATYNLGVGTIERGNNCKVKFEVPSKEWFDLTDKSGKYGVSILEDCKYGSDKPNDNTMRLTLLYTPKVEDSYREFVYQNTQDFGIHDVRYAMYGHRGDWRVGESAWQARFFNQPMMAFELPKHDGVSVRRSSLLRISTTQVGLMALKKMEEGDYLLVRVNELTGRDATQVRLSFPFPIIDAFEVNGQEQKIGEVHVENGSLEFDLSHYTIRSFAVKLQPQNRSNTRARQSSVELPYNTDAISFDSNRSDGEFNNQMTIPAEELPVDVISEDVHFNIQNKTDGQKNAVICKGQTIQLPQGKHNRLCILAAATEDTQGEFVVKGQITKLNVQKWTGYIGQFYNRVFTPDFSNIISVEKPYSKPDNIAWFASHRHLSSPSKNDAYQYSYLFNYKFDIPDGTTEITLPDNPRIRIFSMTLLDDQTDESKPLQPLYNRFE